MYGKRKQIRKKGKRKNDNNTSDDVYDRMDNTKTIPISRDWGNLTSPHPKRNNCHAKSEICWLVYTARQTHTQAQPHTLLNVNEENEQHQQIFRYFLVCREMFPP